MFDIIRQIIPENININWDTLLEVSVMSSDKKLVESIYNLKPKNIKVNWNMLLINAIGINDKYMFINLINMSKKHKYKKDFNAFVLESIDMLNIQFFDEIVKLAPSNYNWNIEDITNTIEGDVYIFTHVKESLKIL